MTQGNVKVDEILTNPIFRNGLHLFGTIIFGYILLRLLLYLLDVTHFGVEWLTGHQTSGFLIIVLILILSVLLIDVAISQGRRRYIDEKYSIAETGISYFREKTQSEDGIIPQFIKQDLGVIRRDINLSKITGAFGRRKDSKKKKSTRILHFIPRRPNIVIKSQRIEVKENVNPSTVKPIVSSDMMGSFNRSRPINPRQSMLATEQIMQRTLSVKKPLESGKLNEIVPFTEKTGDMTGQDIVAKPGVKLNTKPVDAKIAGLPNPEVKPVAKLGDVIKKPEYTSEPQTNIVFTDISPITVKKGRSVVKAFESLHNICLIEFESRTDKEDVEISVELLKRSSRLATPIRDKNLLVYEFDNIWVNLSDEQIVNALVKFSVNHKWINTNQILAIQFEQYVGGNWIVVSSNRVDEDAHNRYYEAHVTSLSGHFAITGTSLK